MSLNQESRSLAINTPLGADVLAVRRITVQEHMSQLFALDAELRSENASIDFDKVVGHNVTIRLEMQNDVTRYFNGYVSRFVQVPNSGALAVYQAVIVPWLWFLTQNTDSRIFQEQSVPDIVVEVFRAHGFSDYKVKLNAAYPKREYCVQYRETDFNFVSRLMEEEGIYYFFQHENGSHMLVLADAASAHKAGAGYEEIRFRELEKSSTGEVINDWMMEKGVQPTNYAINNYDFKKPKADLRSASSVDRQHGAARFEAYDYPGNHLTKDDGDRLAQVRLDELQSSHVLIKGKALARGMASGSTFKLIDHPRDDQNQEYLITGVSLHVDAGEFGSGDAAMGEFFLCEFTAIPTSQTFRPRRTTQKSVVQGPQTAQVVGPAGEEIYVDEYGRVKVRFHWDRESKGDENSSCWIRVAQVWAGKKWGSIYTPRIGHEVIVDFLEGDPDQPIVCGRVYNDIHRPPYKLPDHKTISTLKSSSSPGGQGFNEIRFEDKKGEEHIFIHGEKNLDMRVRQNTYEWNGGSRHLIIQKSQFEKVEGDRHEEVGKDHVEKIGKDRHITVAGKENIEVAETHSFKVTGDVAEEFAANHSEVVEKDLFIKAQNIVLEALTNLTIKVGNNYIAIASDGIKIGAEEPSASIQSESTGDTTINSSMNLSLKAQMEAKVQATVGLKLESSATAELSGAMTTTKASGIMTISGAMVKIN